MTEKPAETGRPIHDIIRRRWSPRAFDTRSVGRDDLATLFEAARWAPSCFNEQPWRYVVAEASTDPEGHRNAGSLLTEGNAWARNAPVLALSLARPTFTRNGKPNRHAWHDVGAASLSIALEAVHRGLVVHQMAGFDRSRAREVFGIPEDWEPVAMIAIGHQGSADALPEGLREREKAPRARRSLDETVYGSTFGSALEL